VLFAISQHCTRLRALDLSKCQNISNGAIAAVANRCGDTLIELKLSWTDTSDVGLWAIGEHCSRLEKFELASCPRITDVGLSHIMSGCTALRALDLKRCSQLSGACFATMSATDASLQELVLSSCCSITSENLSIMAERCKKLVSLNLTGIFDAGFAVECIVKNCSQLEHLILNSVFGIPCATIHLMAECRLPLQSLFLEGCENVSDEAVCLLAQSCPNLKILSLRFTNISDVSLIGISKHLTQLTALAIAGCSVISDRGLEAIMVSCKKLEELSISSTPISDAGLNSVVKHGMRLKKLGCDDLRNVTKEGWRVLDDFKGVELVLTHMALPLET
jgi:hypothetical protein